MVILSALQTLGLRAKEAAVYAALLEVKKGTAQSVSETAGIKRPTTYQVLESLCQKKLVAVTKFRNVRDYRALPLEHLKGYVREQKIMAEVALPEMQKSYDARRFKVRLRVYHGLSDIKTLLEKSLRERARMDIFGDEKMFQNWLGAFWEFYCKRAGQLKILPKFKPCAGPIALLVWNDKTAFIKFGEKIQVFAFKNKSLYALYHKLWTNF